VLTRYRILTVVFLSLILPGIHACSAVRPEQPSTRPPDFVIEGMVIRNELPFPVTGVMINIPDTGEFAGCGNIMPRSECSTSFEPVDYYSQKFVVVWEEYGQPHQTGEFIPEAGEGLNPAKPVWVEVVIFAMGQAGATLVQD